MLLTTPAKLRFNSTMVRLKVERDLRITTLFFVFQFHDGSIKGMQDRAHAHNLDMVSIPRWFD